MIRTRDFLVFSGVMVVLLVALISTIAGDVWGGGQHMATATKFAINNPVSGAVADTREIDTNSNAERLRSKIAAGEGNSPLGEPVFTSVDDFIETPDTVTDESTPNSFLLGYTVDGLELWNHDLWRFVGYSQFEQIGVALNGTPIYGSHIGVYRLDACGGIDEGMGYRLHLRSGEDSDPACFAG